jgi:hypothetical protein
MFPGDTPQGDLSNSEDWRCRCRVENIMCRINNKKYKHRMNLGILESKLKQILVIYFEK